MRALILVAGAALAVSACSSNEPADNTMNADENLTTEIANDPLTDVNAADANLTLNATDGNVAVDANADANADATANNAM